MKAIALKISAARELARRLQDERETAFSGDEPERRRRQQEAQAAAHLAARADASARSVQRATSRSAIIQQLRKQNAALMEVAVSLAADKREAQAAVKRISEQHQEEAPPPSSSEEDIVQVFTQLAESQQVEEQDPETPEEAPEVPQAEAPAEEEEQVEMDDERQLEARADAAAKSGAIFFVNTTTGRARVGKRFRLFYHRSAGPLTGHQGLTLKLGLNQWESIVEMPMEQSRIHDGSWWVARPDLPSELCRADFVLVDDSGRVDSNNAADYQVPLDGAVTPEELIQLRVEQAERFDKQRRKLLAAQRDVVMQEAEDHAVNVTSEAAREVYRNRMAQAELALSTQIVKERRSEAAEKALAIASNQEGRQFFWVGGDPSAGSTATVCYQRNSGSLRHSQDVLLHLGSDAWYKQRKLKYPMQHVGEQAAATYGLQRGQNEEWFSATVKVPREAAVLDFVLSDSQESRWDNNGGSDFHTRVAGALTARQLAEELQRSGAGGTGSRADDKQGEDRAAESGYYKHMARVNAVMRRAEVQQQFLYSEPVVPTAGGEVTVYYNPQLTPLRGRPDIWMQGGYNRWTHSTKVGPVRLEPVHPGGLSFLQAKLQVPPDVSILDLVFSDSGDEHGGFFDDNQGLDYHIPVTGGTGSVPSHHVVHVAVEMAPIAKVGGMADVVTALGRAVMEEGHSAEVVLPKYDCMAYDEIEDLEQVDAFRFGGCEIKVWKGLVEGLPTTFLDPSNGSFWVGCIYGRNDDADRFQFFCDAAVEYLGHHTDQPPTVVHAHDWQTAPLVWADLGAATAFTIHNLNYGADRIGSAMAAVDVATTVSPTYAEEIAGHPSVAPHLDKLFGVRNGIDPDIWDPACDPCLPQGYGPSDLEGKGVAKAALRDRMQLSHTDAPVVGVVTRLTHQKGIHLIKHAAWRTLERGGQFVLLGSAPDPKVQGEFEGLAGELKTQYPDRARLWFAYDEPLSHLIYAGADMLLVPSMFEPCGLTQMIAMRYGTVPVVRRTGGLADTVFDLDEDEERAAGLGMEVNGFNFDGTDAGAIDHALNRALATYFNEPELWSTLVTRVMMQDWSWSVPALTYIELYYKALKAR